MSSDDPGTSQDIGQGSFQCSSGDNSLSQNSTWLLDQRHHLNPNDTDRYRRNSASSDSIGKGLQMSKNGSDVIDKTTNEKVETAAQRHCPYGIQTVALSLSRNINSLPNQSHEDAKDDKTSSNTEDLSSSVASTNPSYDDECATNLKMNPPTAGATGTYDKNLLLGRNDDTSSTRVGPKDDQVVNGTHYPPQSTPLRGRAGSVLTHDLRLASSPYSVPTCQLDMTAFTRTVMITTANRIREPKDLNSYLNWSLGGSYIENVVIDTFSGLVYITFTHEIHAQSVCQMFHDPIKSNILNIRMCQQHEFDFFYDRISVHGEFLRDQGFKKLLLEFLWKKGVLKYYPIIQTGCAKSMILLLENIHTINDMSRLLINISIGFEIMVAPVTRSFIVSVQWYQSLRTDDVVDYIKMKCNEANIVSIKPLNYGLLFYLRDEHSISSILSDASHIIHGLPIEARYFYPCLTAETYHRFEQNRVSCQIHVQNLTSGHYFQQSPFPKKENYSSPSANYTYVLNHHLVQRAGQSQGYEHCLRYAGSDKREISRSADDISFQNWSQSQILRHPPTDERPNPSSHGNISNAVTLQSTSLVQGKENSAIDFRQDELILLVRTKLIDDALKICNDVEVTCDLENCKVFLSGDAKSLILAKFLLEDSVRTTFQQYDLTGLKDEELEIVNMKGFPDKINGEFENRKIHAHMSCENGAISILYDKGVPTANLDKVIRRFLVAKEYKIEKNKVMFYQSKNWSDFLQTFKDEDATDYEFSVIKLNTQKTSLLVVGSPNMHHEMELKLKQFENDNKSKRKEIIFESVLQDYAQKYFADKLKDIEVAVQNKGATVKKTDNAFIIEGLEDGLKDGATKLEKMRDSIKTRKQTLDYPGLSEFLESSAGEDILRTSGKKFSCLIKLCEHGNADESLDESFEENLTLLEYGIIDNCKVTITRGDPENLKVDCIFNFINTSFSAFTNMPTGFLGGQTSWNKIKKDSVFSLGQTIEFTGEKNRNLKIVHFFCNHEERHLIETLKRGFNKVRSMKIKYIGIAFDGIQHLESIPGEFSKPLADQLKAQIHNYPNTVNEIYLCGNNETHLHNVAIQLKLKHQQTKSLGKSKGDVGKIEPKAQGTSSFRPQENQARTNVFSVTAFTMETRSKIVLKPITVELISGDILAQKTDAVVTSIQSDLDMKLGLVIRSVLQKGGDEIQTELHTKFTRKISPGRVKVEFRYPSGIKGGEFAVSGGGKLPFKRIYHANLPQWNSSTSGDVIKRLVKDLLMEASKESLISIAIPALGTGNLSYNSAISCKSILLAIDDFAKVNQQTSLRTVKLVIFTTNTDIMKEYEHVIFNFETASQLQAKINTPIPTPISPIKKANVSYGNIDVKLTIGDITMQKTDAIIVSVDGSLDLTKGRVAHSILNQGGQGIQTELKLKYPNGLKVYEYGMTRPGNLSCKEVYFVCIPHWNKFDNKEMKKLIDVLLTAVDKAKGATVSLPAFGTGNLGYPADKTQEHILKGIAAFAKGHRQYLRSIEIVVHPSDSVVQQAFQKRLLLPITATAQQTSQQHISKEKNESPGILTKFLLAFGLGTFASFIGLGEQKSTDNTFAVGTVTLTVKKGDITEESCDALVAAVNDNMDLESAGAVCYEISKKCAADFKSKCLSKANDLKVYGLTSVDVQGGSLKCKEIFFISMNHYHDNLDLAVTKVLERADKIGFTTLAMPTLGAGLPDTDINKLISQIKVAITKFGNDQPRKLKDIRLVVYDKDMLKRVSNANNVVNNRRKLMLKQAWVSVEKAGTEETSCPYVALTEDDDDELSENAHIVYYFVDDQKVKGAMEEVMNQCMVAHKENSYKNISIKQFTDANFKSLEKKGNENMIKVTCIKDEGRICMAGFGDLSTVQNMIHAIEKEKQREMFENLSTDTPVHWQYEVDGKFVDFNNLLNLQLEADFKGKKSSSVIEMEDETYIVDFENKIITHNDTGSIMNLSRRDALEAGEPIPKHWEHMSVNESLKVVDLPADSVEYNIVAENFRFKGAAGNINKIERVQNRSLYQQFIAKKREIDGRNPNHENELLLFHGSDINAISAINNTGFNRSYCGKNATVYGLGVYFAQSSAYSEQYASPDSNGLRKLYQTRVLVGVSVETDSNTKFLPKQPGSDIPYDSGKAPASRTEGIHVIFHDSQAYPEYIITFALPVNHVAP